VSARVPAASRRVVRAIKRRPASRSIVPKAICSPRRHTAGASSTTTVPMSYERGMKKPGWFMRAAPRPHLPCPSPGDVAQLARAPALQQSRCERCAPPSLASSPRPFAASRSHAVMYCREPSPRVGCLRSSGGLSG
jgi:hypothetical protein